MSGVPYTFGTATTSIPLSNLDSNFVTPITIGNASVALGNTITAIGNLTLNNVTINSGTSNISANITLGNTTISLGTTATTIGNLTLTNPTIIGGTSNVTSTSITNGTSNVTILSSGGAVNIATNGTNAITVDTSQNVGIGTSSPSVALTIQSSGEGFYLSRDGGNAPDIRLRQSRGTFASKTISVNGDLTGQLHFEGYDGSAYLDVALIGGVIDGVVSAGVVPTAIRFATGSTTLTERMRIDSSGNLLVGTTSATISGSSYKEVLNQSTSGTGRCLAITDNINTSGFAIAIFSTSGYAGGISYSGTTATFNSSSDYRLKNNTTPIQNALNTISQLNPVTFTWRFDNKADAGFLAHEFQSILPNYVQGEKDAIDKDGNPEYQSMDNSGVIPFLVKAIQEQQALIESLTTRLTALENK